MEKFKKFSDPQTGLNPFLPVKVERSFIGKILGMILAPFRLVIFLLVLLGILISQLIFKKNNKICVIIEQILSRFILFIFGVRVEKMIDFSKT